MKPKIIIRIVLDDPPTGVAFALQRVRSDLVQAIAKSAARMVFEFPVVVADLATQPIRLTGEFTQGPAAVRFVYINVGTSAGQFGSPWTRRIKVPIYGIDRSLAEAVLDVPGKALECRVAGKGRDGSPACASVPLISGWTVVRSAGKR
ncbi:MAG: hypothetical protein H7147_07140 [Frankiaceae bacterium]|nr:hypothetical protein [Arenimonas sp.]